MIYQIKIEFEMNCNNLTLAFNSNFLKKRNAKVKTKFSFDLDCFAIVHIPLKLTKTVALLHWLTPVWSLRGKNQWSLWRAARRSFIYLIKEFSKGLTG